MTDIKSQMEDHTSELRKIEARVRHAAVRFGSEWQGKSNHRKRTNRSVVSESSRKTSDRSKTPSRRRSHNHGPIPKRSTHESSTSKNTHGDDKRIDEEAGKVFERTDSQHVPVAADRADTARGGTCSEDISKTDHQEFSEQPSQVPIDSGDYLSSVCPSESPPINDKRPIHVADAIRSAEVADSRSTDERVEAKTESSVEVMERAYSTSPSLRTTDVDADEDSSDDYEIDDSESDTPRSLEYEDDRPYDDDKAGRHVPYSDESSSDENASLDFDNRISLTSSTRSLSERASLSSSWGGGNNQSDCYGTRSLDLEAFALLNLVRLGPRCEIPVVVNWDLFTRFLLVADRVREHAGTEPFTQARTWVSAFQISKTLDKDALTWLWITWKLGMSEEFKALTGSIQRSAPRRIESSKALRVGEYAFDLPQDLCGTNIMHLFR